MIAIYGGLTVKQGTFRYAESVTCDVQIVQTEMRWGSGDRDDPAGLQDDLPGPCFYVEWGSTTTRGEYSAGGVGYATLEEAMRAVEQQVVDVAWSDQAAT